ncbi:secretion system protein [Georgenia deserti]|uniref:Secretion system protein n=1 Tax=Georgenia deserti TaxID=2093781 RepID=A0ABW4LA47_9MICO
MTPAVVLVLGVVAVLPWLLTRRGPLPPRRPAPATTSVGGVDVAVLLDLADAALSAGSSVPGTLTALGRAVDPAQGAGTTGTTLAEAGRSLLLGAPWAEAWDDAPPSLHPLRDALEPAWVDGAAPGPLLRQAAAGLRAARTRQAQEAAARLGVRLVLPLGLCYLPAFVLVGVVPVVLGAGWLVLGS